MKAKHLLSYFLIYSVFVIIYISLIIVSCGKSTTNGVKNDIHSKQKHFQERVISPFQEVVNEFAEFSQIEISLGTVVIEKGSTAGIRELGRLMVIQHEKLLLKTEKMAYSMGLTLTSTASENHKALLQKLNYFENVELDSYYQNFLLESHQTFLARINNMAIEQKDSAINEWITTSIPIINLLIKSTHACIKSNPII